MSFLTRSALLAGSSLKNGAKVSALHLIKMEQIETNDEIAVKIESENLKKKIE